MTKNKKMKRLKPCLAWCVVQDVGSEQRIMPGWCCETKALAREWFKDSGVRIVRVKITEVRK